MRQENLEWEGVIESLKSATIKMNSDSETDKAVALSYVQLSKLLSGSVQLVSSF